MYSQKFVFTLQLTSLLGCLWPIMACGSPQKKPAAPETKSDTTPPESEEPPEEKYVEAICSENAFMSCYEKFNFNGAIDGSAVADITVNGTIASVTYSGEAPKPVQDCILETVQSKKQLEGFTGGALQITCRYSGSLSGGVRTIMWSASYQHLPPE